MSLAITIENPFEIKDELLPLHESHYSDDFRKEDTKLEIDWDLYKVMYDQGATVNFIARNDGEIVGYMFFNMFPHHQNKGAVFADMDALFVAEECRGQGIAKELLAEAEKYLKEIQVDYISAGFRSERSAESVLGSSFKKVEYKYCKHLRN